METLHVYGQEAWHDPAWIAGDRDGLLRLREAIDKALQSGLGVIEPVFTADGEGYVITVMQLNKDELSAMELPYTVDYARGSGGTTPWDQAQTLASKAT